MLLAEMLLIVSQGTLHCIVDSLFIKFIKLVRTEEGLHLWPKRLPFLSYNMFPAF